MAHTNEDLMRNGYEAFSKGDMETVRNLFAEDIAWHVGGRSPVAGEYRGQDEVFGFLAKLVELSGGTFRLEVHDVLANDEHAIVLAETHGERGGKWLEDRVVHVWHMKDGKATEFWGHPADQYATDEFWS